MVGILLCYRQKVVQNSRVQHEKKPHRISLENTLKNDREHLGDGLNPASTLPILAHICVPLKIIKNDGSVIHSTPKYLQN